MSVLLYSQLVPFSFNCPAISTRFDQGNVIAFRSYTSIGIVPIPGKACHGRRSKRILEAGRAMTSTVDESVDKCGRSLDTAA
jgi:hypothetical protein